MKVYFTFSKFAYMTIESKLDGIAHNKRHIKPLFYITIESIFDDVYISPKQIDFESLKICQGFDTIEEAIQNAAQYLNERYL